jgi:hypothetical protein
VVAPFLSVFRLGECRVLVAQYPSVVPAQFKNPPCWEKNRDNRLDASAGMPVTRPESCLRVKRGEYGSSGQDFLGVVHGSS